MQTTFVMLKPDAIQRNLVGRIISRIEDKGLQIVTMKMLQMSPYQAKGLYSAHKGKPFYDALIDYTTSSPVIVMGVRGLSAVSVIRRLIGETKGQEAQPGTVRGDFSNTVTNRNLIHASDSLSSAICELSLFFKSNDFCETKLANNEWVYSPVDLEK